MRKTIVAEIDWPEIQSIIVNKMAKEVLNPPGGFWRKHFNVNVVVEAGSGDMIITFTSKNDSRAY